MTETPNLELPLLAPSQAQKHVTVNEALGRLDALAQLTLVSVSQTVPPATLTEGSVYFVPTGAVNEWAGNTQQLAIVQGGGWVFLDPPVGTRGWIADVGQFGLWNGTEWSAIGFPSSASGGAMLMRAAEIDHVVQSGTTSTTSALIPDGALVFAVTGRVIDEITGGATSFEIGVSGATNRYGSGIGTVAGSWLRGVTSAPVAYFADTSLVLTATGGTFTGGTLRLVAHFAEFSLPSTT